MRCAGVYIEGFAGPIFVPQTLVDDVMPLWEMATEYMEKTILAGAINPGSGGPAPGPPGGGGGGNTGGGTRGTETGGGGQQGD